MQTKWGSTRGTAAGRRQKEVYTTGHCAHEDYKFDGQSAPLQGREEVVADRPQKPPAEGHGEDRRVTRKTRSAIHSGALPIVLPLTGSQQAGLRGPAANAVRFTPNLGARDSTSTRLSKSISKTHPLKDPPGGKRERFSSRGLRSANLVAGLSSPLLCAPARLSARAPPPRLLGIASSGCLPRQLLAPLGVASSGCLAACFGAPLDSA